MTCTIIVHVGEMETARVTLSEKESAMLLARSYKADVSTARTLLHALRVFDLYLAGRLKMEPSDSPGCGVIE